HLLPGRAGEHTVLGEHHERGRRDRPQLLDLRQLLPTEELLQSAEDRGTGERDRTGPGSTAGSVLLPVRRPRARDVRSVHRRQPRAGPRRRRRVGVTITRPAAAEVAPGPERGRLLDWLTTTDHKRIGILYLINSFSFFVIAGIFALLMRTELARPGTQIFAPKAYEELFTLHGTLMIFLVIFPLLAGFGNYFVPLQIGALDMAFPRINALSFWLLPVGGLTILSGFFLPGGAAAAGWTNY